MEATKSRSLTIRAAAKLFKDAYKDEVEKRFRKVGHAGVVLGDLIDLCEKTRQGIITSPDESVKSLQTHFKNGNIIVVRDDGSIVGTAKNKPSTPLGVFGSFKKQRRAKDRNCASRPISEGMRWMIVDFAASFDCRISSISSTRSNNAPELSAPLLLQIRQMATKPARVLLADIASNWV